MGMHVPSDRLSFEVPTLHLVRMSSSTIHVGDMRLPGPRASLFIYRGRRSCQARERGRRPRLTQNNRCICLSLGSILHPEEEGGEAARSDLGARRLQQVCLPKALTWEATLLTLALTEKSHRPRGRHLQNRRRQGPGGG